MDTGKVIKIIKNVPSPIPIKIPLRKSKEDGDTSAEPERVTRYPIGIPEPIRREEKVPAQFLAESNVPLR